MWEFLCSSLTVMCWKKNKEAPWSLEVQRELYSGPCILETSINYKTSPKKECQKLTHPYADVLSNLLDSLWLSQWSLHFLLYCTSYSIAETVKHWATRGVTVRNPLQVLESDGLGKKTNALIWSCGWVVLAWGGLREGPAWLALSDLQNNGGMSFLKGMMSFSTF